LASPDAWRDFYVLLAKDPWRLRPGETISEADGLPRTREFYRLMDPPMFEGARAIPYFPKPAQLHCVFVQFLLFAVLCEGKNPGRQIGCTNCWGQSKVPLDPTGGARITR